MILRLETEFEAVPNLNRQQQQGTSAECIPAWIAVNQRQHTEAESYWLIAQPDHAQLSGELAANFANPKLEDAIVRGIGLHDAGWGIFDAEINPGADPLLMASGKPRSFTEMPPSDFVRAWGSSIQQAEQIAPVAGLMVSRHFRNLGEFALQRGQEPEDSVLIRDFLHREVEREQRLQALAQRSPEQIERYVKALQFCDLLSLYLCCGASEYVEFPFDFGIGTVRVHRENGNYQFSPSPFAEEVRLCVPARCWGGLPSGSSAPDHSARSRQIQFVLR
jgi:hypothetical protein